MCAVLCASTEPAFYNSHSHVYGVLPVRVEQQEDMDNTVENMLCHSCSVLFDADQTFCSH